MQRTSTFISKVTYGWNVMKIVREVSVSYSTGLYITPHAYFTVKERCCEIWGFHDNKIQVAVFWPWRQRQYGPSKGWFPTTSPVGVNNPDDDLKKRWICLHLNTCLSSTNAINFTTTINRKLKVISFPRTSLSQFATILIQKELTCKLSRADTSNKPKTRLRFTLFLHSQYVNVKIRMYLKNGTKACTALISLNNDAFQTLRDLSRNKC
jgi:hypothetical protein